MGTISRVDLDRVRSRLRRNASLFDRPEDYVAGVEDAVAAIAALADGHDADSIIQIPEAQTSRMI